MTNSLVILTLNEIAGSQALWPHLPLEAFDEVIVVDGGSNDGTVKFFLDKGIRVVGQDKPGRGEAFRVGAAHTTGDRLVFFSPDGNEDPADIVRLVACLDKGADLAIASRFAKGSRNEEDDGFFRPRAWVNQLLTLTANVLFRKGPYITDTINGFRAIRRDVFAALFLDECGFPIEYQMSIRAMKAGFKIVEIPTYEGARIGGDSKCLSWPVGVGHLKVLLREILGMLGPGMSALIS